jgi:hypothetical protein
MSKICYHLPSESLNISQEMQPADVETIDEMIEQNFTFYSSPLRFELIKQMEFIKR